LRRKERNVRAKDGSEAKGRKGYQVTAYQE
jgi:hypothetical protein